MMYLVYCHVSKWACSWVPFLLPFLGENVRGNLLNLSDVEGFLQVIDDP